MKKTEMPISRRQVLMSALFGSGMIGLRALATGFPAWLLADPRRALANPPPAGCVPSNQLQYVIYSCSDGGDPINANVPGTYLDPGIVHPADPSMTPTPLTLSGTQYTAAAPWSTLPQSVLDRTCFFHHGTYTVVHPDLSKVQNLQGAVAHNEMLVSAIAAQLAPCLGTVQTQPFVLGPRSPTEDVTFQGAPQPIISPTALSSLLAAPGGALGKLQQIRDADVDKMNAWFKANGNTAQRAFIDKYVQSQSQARKLSQTLLAQLSSIPDNSADSQCTAAVTLIQMNVAPVISINIPFGGDNHSDAMLQKETTETVAGVASIAGLQQKLAAVGLQDRVSFLSLNVFGRTLTGVNGQPNGRNHLGNHHCAVMIGKPFRGGVIGGVETGQGDYIAQSIDSKTGQGVPKGGGDIAFLDTLSSMGQTFCVGIGLDPGAVSQFITSGTVVTPALLSA